MWEKRITGRPKDNKIACCGACDLMGTANTFQCMAEALGLTLPGTANIPGFHIHKQLYARQAGKRIVDMVDEGLTARKILTEKSLENAVIMDLAIGGSTNSTLHLPAIAHELGLTLPLSRFNDLNRKIPTLLSIDPNGVHSVVDLYAAGGTPAVMKVMAGDLHLEALCVNGRTMKEVVEEAKVMDETVIRPKDKPWLPEGGTVILFGNLAPDGAVVKQSAVSRDMLVFSGKARVFDSEALALNAFRNKEIQEGRILIIRYEGPTWPSLWP
jgi:dihydroxy-acid dehydratase